MYTVIYEYMKFTFGIKKKISFYLKTETMTSLGNKLRHSTTKTVSVDVIIPLNKKV